MTSPEKNEWETKFGAARQEPSTKNFQPIASAH
jgi:hypothetical protein